MQKREIVFNAPPPSTRRRSRTNEGFLLFIVHLPLTPTEDVAVGGEPGGSKFGRRSDGSHHMPRCTKVAGRVLQLHLDSIFAILSGNCDCHPNRSKGSSIFAERMNRAPSTCSNKTYPAKWGKSIFFRLFLRGSFVLLHSFINSKITLALKD